VGDDAFTPGTGEVDLDHQGGVAVSIRGERGKMGTAILTNDRILFTQQKFAAAGGGALAALAADRLQQRSEKKSGPREVLALTEVTGARRNRRRFLPDLYEFTLNDGSTSWLSENMRERWDAQIRRLLAERHGRSTVDEADEAWRVE
jgi:hypothetical protein